MKVIIMNFNWTSPTQLVSGSPKKPCRKFDLRLYFYLALSLSLGKWTTETVFGYLLWRCILLVNFIC